MKFFDPVNYDRNVAVVPVGADVVTLTGTSGTATITVNGVDYLATFDTDLDETSEDFVASHRVALNLRGIKVVATGSVKQVDTVSVTGASGTANIAVAGGLGPLLLTFNSTLTLTCSDFVTANEAAYLAVGIVLTSSVADLIFTSVDLGGEFAHPTITAATGDLDGTVANTTAPASVLTFTHKRAHIVTNRVACTIANVSGDLSGTLTATFTPDFNIGRVYQLAVACPVTIAKALNLRDGQYVRFEITTAGNYTVTWNAAYQFAGGTEHTQTSTALDILAGNYNAAADKVYLTLESSDVKA